MRAWNCILSFYKDALQSKLESKMCVWSHPESLHALIVLQLGVPLEYSSTKCIWYTGVQISWLQQMHSIGMIEEEIIIMCFSHYSSLCSDLWDLCWWYNSDLVIPGKTVTYWPLGMRRYRCAPNHKPKLRNLACRLWADSLLCASFCWSLRAKPENLKRR